MNVKQLFLNAYNIIKNEKTWTQGAYARTSLGLGCFHDDEDAVKFCSMGAIFKASERGEASRGILILSDRISKHLTNFDISKFNDTHTHEEVVAFWEKVGKAEGWL